MNTSISSQLYEALEKSKTASHRALLVLSGDRASCWQLLDTVLCDTTFQEKLVFQATQACPSDYTQLKRARDFLGSNNDCVVFDAWGGFDPDAFGIISGSINGGGLLILITPSISRWPHFPDPVNKRLAVHPLNATDISGRYLRRVCSIIVNKLPETEAAHDVECRWLVSETVSYASKQLLPNPEQNQLVSRVVQLVSDSNARNPMFVTADRGRGKSTALGLAASKILTCGLVSNVIVTAPGKSALISFFQAVDKTDSRANNQSRPQFLPTDILMRDLPVAALLIIDEAAAIPLPILLHLIDSYPLCILSSTMHGYEGSGRGFALRLRKRLDERHKNWQETTLTFPARFATNDPLEAFTAELLMLNATPESLLKNTFDPYDDYQLRELSAEVLVENECRLKELFGLLVQSHYQTKPLDLKHLLDGPNLRVFALIATTNEIVAALLLATEQIANDVQLQEAIIHGERRPRGHLLSQQLAYQSIDKNYLNLRLIRIVRIAVLPSLQSKSLGSLLLNKLSKFFSSERIDGIGASFGATTELLRFWHNNQYQIHHLGYKRKATSAAYSAVVFRSLSMRAKLLSIRSIAQFHNDIRFRENHSVCFPTEIDIRSISYEVDFDSDAAFTNAVVSSYAYRHRDFESSHTELHRYLSHMDLANAEISATQVRLLNTIILQCKTWQSVSEELGLRGRKSCEALMRTTLQKICEHI